MNSEVCYKSHYLTAPHERNDYRITKHQYFKSPFRGDSIITKLTYTTQAPWCLSMPKAGATHPDSYQEFGSCDASTSSATSSSGAM